MPKIYGVFEEVSFRGLFHTANVNEKHPDLFDIVNNTKDCKIGIESFGNENYPKVKAGEVGTKSPKIYSELYNALKENNKVILLDTEFEKFHESIKKEFPKERLTLPNERYRFNIKSQHYVQIKRTDVELSNIRKENPDAAFVGGAHAYDMYCEGEKEVFMEYPLNLEEVTDKVNRAFKYCDNEDIIKGALKSIDLSYGLCHIENLSQEQKEELRKISKGVEKIRRLYDYMENKPYEKNPDFIGTWSLYKNNGLEGFFEMYIDQRDGDQIKGLIKDSLGNAKFNGKINDWEVQFNKEYTYIFDDRNGYELVVYQGCRDGQDSYKGKFKFPNGSIFKPLPFVLCRYSPEMQKKIVDVKDREEIITESEEEIEEIPF